MGRSGRRDLYAAICVSLGAIEVPRSVNHLLVISLKGLLQ